MVFSNQMNLGSLGQRQRGRRDKNLGGDEMQHDFSRCLRDLQQSLEAHRTVRRKGAAHLLDRQWIGAGLPVAEDQRRTFLGAVVAYGLVIGYKKRDAALGHPPRNLIKGREVCGDLRRGLDLDDGRWASPMGDQEVRCVPTPGSQDELEGLVAYLRHPRTEHRSVDEVPLQGRFALDGRVEDAGQVEDPNGFRRRTREHLPRGRMVCRIHSLSRRASSAPPGFEGEDA